MPWRAKLGPLRPWCHQPGVSPPLSPAAGVGEGPNAVDLMATAGIEALDTPWNN
jgi:hypothetical protein